MPISNSEIVRLRDLGYSLREIQRISGYTRNKISGILHRKGRQRSRIQGCTARVLGGAGALESLRLNQCHYPLGEPQSPGFRFCAQPVRSGSSYCKEHHRLCCSGFATRWTYEDRP